MARGIFCFAVLGLAAACGSSFAGTEGSGGGAGQAGTGGSGTATGGGSAGSSGGGAGGAGSGSGGTTGGRSDGGTSSDGGTTMGGTTGGTTTGGTGGDGVGGAPGDPCPALMQNYMKEVDKLRDCDVGAPEPQCNHDWTFEVSCGCPVAVNGDKDPALAEAARAELDENNCVFVVCEMACPELTGTCAALENTLRFVCQ
jgi:hypothetical protein